MESTRLLEMESLSKCAESVNVNDVVNPVSSKVHTWIAKFKSVQPCWNIWYPLGLFFNGIVAD
jgi:hypothetical protein